MQSGLAVFRVVSQSPGLLVSSAPLRVFAQSDLCSIAFPASPRFYRQAEPHPQRGFRMIDGPAATRVAVILASTGRPDSLATAIASYLAQTQRPTRIILSVVSEDDLPRDAGLLAQVETLTGPKGSSVQRNTALRHLAADADIITFFDDDYLPSRFCIEQIARFFTQNPDVAGANGLLLGDGINSAGIELETAIRLIDEYDSAPTGTLGVIRSLEGLYGCNMAYRASATKDIWFDERLKLYGWQEDIDFAAQVAVHGRIVKTHAFAGVHQGVKRGRTSGVRFGYSQVVNPLYLCRKGTMPTGFALRMMGRNLLANHIRALRPEPWVDRAGRVRGNWIGLMDIMRGRLTPERIEML
jgi:GT2 family glycosyltransferase